MFRCLKAQPEDSHTVVIAQLKAPILVWVLCMLLSGCGQTVRAPITDKHIGTADANRPKYSSPPASKSRSAPKVYTVIRGDTLQAIAWRFGLNHHEIARWNNIRNANLIYVGQRLRLTAPGTRKQTTSKPRKSAPAKQAAGKPKTVISAKLSWQWPAVGKVSKANSALGARGIEIHGKRGSAIKAAAAGKVVYSGNGLRGYGNLVIIQHNDTYLSAYAHNEKIQVAEGEVVGAGQLIASMGNSGTKQVMLHFEIRRNGKAVEPINYLPRR